MSPNERSPTVCTCYPPQCFHARRNMTPAQRSAADRRMAEKTHHQDKEAVRRDRRS